MTPLLKTGLVALALLLVLTACGQGEETTATTQPYEFPVELIVAGEAAAAQVTNTTVPPVTTAPSPVEPPPLPQIAAEALEGDGRPLALPSSALLPGVGTLAPQVVTDAGERRLLSDVHVSVTFDPDTGFVVDPAGWWVINYPLEWIYGAQGRTADEIATTLFGKPADEVTNYYFYTAPGAREKVQAVAEATEPAPVRIVTGPTLVVDNQDPNAADDNTGSPAQPLLTIGEAVSRAAPGDTIHVYPGTYRESVEVTTDGTAGEPIRIEGIRGASGAMPVITGNDQFPDNAWSPVEGLRGVYRAEAFTGVPGTLAVDGQALVERSAPWDLRGGEYVVTTGGEAYVDPRFDGDVRAREGTVYDFGSSRYIWEVAQTDDGGFLDLGTEFGEEFEGGVYWGSAWVYVKRPDMVEDYQWYGTNDFDLQVSGPFRAGRVAGSPLAEQPYEYRVWLDGELLDGHIRADAANEEAELPHPVPGRGSFGESWLNVVMRKGWHHLVFQWDTTKASSADAPPPLFRFDLPEVIGEAVSSAAKPARLWRAPQGEAKPYVSEFMLLGPVPSSYDPSVFLRLPGDADPNDYAIDLAARSGPVVSILGDFVEFRGFDVRHGAQADGDALIEVGRRRDEPGASVFVQGVVVEGNKVHGSEAVGIKVAVEGDQGMAPIAVTNNWVVDPGSVGIEAEGNSSRLTPQTLNDWAPGRTPVSVANNTIVNAGWAGYDRLHDVSGIVFTRMTGSSIMHNTIIGGGPGITLTVENYAVRVDGNRIIDPWGWGVGVEANPGPNLIANNLITGLRAGPEWKKAHLLTWDSDQTWLINNTTDGEWGIETGWFGDIGSWGAGGPENFTRIEYDTWQMEFFRRTYINNLFLGSYLGGVEDYQGNWGEWDTFNSNYREVPSPDPFDYLEDGAEKAKVRWAFLDRKDGDYRLRSDSDLNSAGTLNLTSESVTHDLYGLLRHLGESTPVGAFRVEPDLAPGASVIEVEFADGTAIRIDG
ncbi:MAG: hypothetical protein QNJ89_02865 [Acidimicrobiia bacterium]|nr:hypothetical protein [Acidimicrobiia bacterium]